MGSGGSAGTAMTAGAVEAAWRRVAARIGGSYTARGGTHVLQLREPDWILTLDRIQAELGPATRLRAPFHNPRMVSLRIREEGGLDDLWKTLGFVQEVDSGEAAFDDRFLVKGQPRRVLREIVGDGSVRALLAAQPTMDLRILTQMMEPRLPSGVHILYFIDRTWPIVDVDRLVGLFELFRALLTLIRPLPAGWEEDPDLILERLEGPGGTARDIYNHALLWDGHAPRWDAARRLGAFPGDRVRRALLAALEDRDPGLVAGAAGSLAEVGDARAVAPLARLLGERRLEAGGRPLADHAADALEVLGRGPLVRAFAAALEGDPGPLREAAGPDGETREALVRALMDVVESAEFGARARAARTLGALGAREALPLLRSKSTAWGMRTRLTEAAGEAVREIESRAALPRPAERTPDEAGTLPRPADVPDASSGYDERLPRAADEES